jgi:hypothetical protein
LRLETGCETDKEKSEVYFQSRIKKFLTKNCLRIAEPAPEWSSIGTVDRANLNGNVAADSALAASAQ